MLMYTQSIQVVNFSNIAKGTVNVIITCDTEEGQSVKLEALGVIDNTYVHSLEFICQAMWTAAQEAPINCSGPFAPLTLPTYNQFVKNFT